MNSESVISATDSAHAVEAVRRGQESPYLRIFKSTVFVRNHDRSLQFYVGQLGFSVLADARFEFGGRWVAVAPPDGSAAGEEFGEERLIEALLQRPELPARRRLASVVDEIQKFSPHEQQDDITLIVAKCRGES